MLDYLRGTKAWMISQETVRFKLRLEVTRKTIEENETA